MWIAVLHGPNLNLLGSRQPELYGHTTLAQIDADLIRLGGELKVRVTTSQHNGEGSLIDALHEAADADGLLINPAAYTHTSVALRDALLALNLPTVAVHLTEPNQREFFRQIDLIEDIVSARVAGLGAASYSEGLRKLVALLRKRAKKPHL